MVTVQERSVGCGKGGQRFHPWSVVNGKKRVSGVGRVGQARLRASNKGKTTCSFLFS